MGLILFLEKKKKNHIPVESMLDRLIENSCLYNLRFDMWFLITESADEMEESGSLRKSSLFLEAFLA